MFLMLHVVPFFTLLALYPFKSIHVGIVVRTLINLVTEVTKLVFFEVLSAKITNLHLLTVRQLHFTQTDRLFRELSQLRSTELEVVALEGYDRIIVEGW